MSRPQFRGEDLVQTRNMRSTATPVAGSPATGFEGRALGSRAVGLPTMACLMLATVSFGAARIHAGAVDPAASAAPGYPISIRIVDFKPDTFTPAAFADWPVTSER
jgi:hypothetical protein